LKSSKLKDFTEGTHPQHPTGSKIRVAGGTTALNFISAQQLLGSGQSPRSDQKQPRKSWNTLGLWIGFSRFICGTQEIHKQLEEAVSKFLGTEDTILMPLALTPMAEFLNHSWAKTVL
jgi:glycine C-acetyltransferase